MKVYDSFYIDGQWVKALGTETFTVIDPATEEPIASVPMGNTEDVDRAVAHARDAGAGVGDAKDKPWGDRVAVVTDPDGYRWVLATFKKLAPFS